jgi:glycosyltransferase involved in cell wall biosynthesis
MKILWVCPLFLHPTTKGGQIRTLETLRRLHRRHEIHFAALYDPAQPEGPDRSGEYCAKAYPIAHVAPPHSSARFYLQAASGFISTLPVAIARYRSAPMRSLLARLTETERFDAIVCDFLAAAPNLPRLEEAVLFQHNVETTIWERHFRNAASPIHRALYRRQERQMFHYERQVCHSVRQVIAVSQADADRMKLMFGIEHVGDVPTGVDASYFMPPSDVNLTNDLVFVGSMDWSPNVDGVMHFVEEIWPLITRRLPDCRLTIAGRAPGPSIQALAERDNRIQVTGTVPDTRPYLWQSKVSIVPLRIGGGTRIKIYEAMAAGLPVVSTKIGAEGLPLADGETIVLADEPERFAEHCIQLVQDSSRRSRIGDAGRNLVAAEYSWEASARCFESYLQPGLRDASEATYAGKT